LANAAAATVGYIGMAIWPHRLAAFYPFRPVATWWVVTCVLILATASVAVVRLRWSRPYLTVGWFWYLVMLVPVVGLVQVGSQSMADRFTYLPLVGLLIACVWIVADLLGPLPSRRWVAGACAVAVVGSCAVAARIQVGYWKDSETLWRRAVQVVPNNDLAYANLGRVLADTGRPDEALADFTEAIRIINTHDPETGTGRGAPPAEYAAVLHGSRGLLLARMGRFPEAVPDLREAVRLRPASADRHYELAMALASAGQFQEAIEQGRKATQLEPSRAHFHADLGFVLYRGGDLPAGIKELEEAIRLSPSHGDAARWHYNLASMLNATGRRDESVRELRSALALNPAYEQARRALSEMLKEGR
jgi:tetratricopeptide (TPR) repeat protein